MNCPFYKNPIECRVFFFSKLSDKSLIQILGLYDEQQNFTKRKNDWYKETLG